MLPNKTSIHKAIVLAAGRGTRMGALTSEVPKPMLPIEGKPMLEHIVRRLGQAQISEILIVVGYKRELIERHFGTGFPGVSFVVQEVAEGTAKGVQLGRDFVGKDSFILTFGDIITGADNYVGIGNDLMDHNAAAVVGVKSVDDPWQGAAVYADPDGTVTRMIEKPPRGTSTTRWNSAGLYSFAPAIFDEIETTEKSIRGEYEIATSISQLREHGQRVRMFEMTGAWRDVGRPEDLATAADDLDKSGA